MENDDFRTIVEFFHDTHGTDAFHDALVRAKAFSSNGEMATAAVWERIAEEISLKETDAASRRCPIAA